MSFENLIKNRSVKTNSRKRDANDWSDAVEKLAEKVTPKFAAKCLSDTWEQTVITPEQWLETVEESDSEDKAEMLPVSKLDASLSSDLATLTVNGYQVTPSAWNQLRTKMEIDNFTFPNNILEAGCDDTERGFAKQWFDHRFDRFRSEYGKDLLVKTRHGKVTAFLSEKYGELRHGDVARAIVKHCDKLGITDACRISHFTHLGGAEGGWQLGGKPVDFVAGDATSLKCNLLLGDAITSGFTGHSAAIGIFNDVSGHGSYDLAGFLFTLICANGHVWGRKDRKKSKAIRHLGDMSSKVADLNRKLVEAFESCEVISQESDKVYSQLRELTVPNGQDALTTVASELRRLGLVHGLEGGNLNKTETTGIFGSLLTEVGGKDNVGDMTAYDIVQSVTRYANVADDQRSLQIQKAAGDMALSYADGGWDDATRVAASYNPRNDINNILKTATTWKA